MWVGIAAINGRSTRSITQVYSFLMSSTRFARVNSPVGVLTLVADDAGLREINFPRDGRPAAVDSRWVQDASTFSETTRQLRAYFAGELENFDLALAPAGTQFQQKVWNALCKIHYGQTISYGELAGRIGNPNASRAVGLANGSNPIPIIIPCHRVIGANGKLTGYGGGLEIKEKLLALERRQLRLL
jgi:methylated-DNA-[protein]-cysteine S-methyltransferase